MRRRQLPWMTAVALLVAAAVAQAGTPAQWTLTRAEWSGVTQAAQVIHIKPLRAAVTALDKQPGAKLIVEHNGGEDAVFWAANLEGWLVALGVPSARIVDRTTAIAPDRITLRLQSATE